MLWFTSDIHIGHKKILDFCPTRPGKNMDEMHDALISNWNSHVGAQDGVYHLGDLSFTDKDTTLWFLRQLKFQTLICLLGNHDSYNKLRGWLQEDSRVTILDTPYRELRIDGKFVNLCHYPMEEWNRYYHGSYHLHGHTHGTLAPRGRRLDVGIDSPFVTGKAENRPFSWDEIRNRMEGIEPPSDKRRLAEEARKHYYGNEA